MNRYPQPEDSEDRPGEGIPPGEGYRPPGDGYPAEQDRYGAGFGQPRQQPVRPRFATSQPVVSYAILGLTVLVFVLQLVSQSFFGRDWPALLGMKVNELILQGQYWRLFTPMLLHGGILHIGFNMYALYILGPGLERYFGRSRFLALYIISGFAGNVMSFLFSDAPSLGSSTAIFGLLAAQGVFVYLNRQVFGGMAQRALGNILLIAGINFIIGLSPGIDNWGHFGGLIGGALFAWFGGPLLRVDGWEVVDVRRPRDVVLTAINVSLLFIAVAGVNIYLQTR